MKDTSNLNGRWVKVGTSGLLKRERFVRKLRPISTSWMFGGSSAVLIIRRMGRLEPAEGTGVDRLTINSLLILVYFR